MTAVTLHALQHIAHLLWQITVDPIHNQFCVAKNGIERRPQFMTHVRKELGFMFTRQLKLLAIVLNLAEQPSILNGQDGLGGKGLQQFHGSVDELSRLLSSDDESTYDLCLPEQRDNQQRAVAGMQNNLVHW